MAFTRFTDGGNFRVGQGIFVRIAAVISSADDFVLKNNQMPEFNHQVNVTKGVLEEACSNMLTTFFCILSQRYQREKPQGGAYLPAGVAAIHSSRPHLMRHALKFIAVPAAAEAKGSD